MRKKLSKWIQGLLFTRTLKALGSKKKLFFFILLFDLLLLISISLLNNIIKMFIPEDYSILASWFSSVSGVLIFALFYTIGYFALILIVYSFIKYCILDLVKSVFSRHSFNISRLWGFYRLNIMIIGIPFVIVIMFAMIVSILIQREYAALLLAFIMLPVLFFYYPFFNLCQSMFYKQNKNPIRNSLRITFKGIQKYISIYLTSIMLLAAYYIISLIFTLVFKYALFRTEELYHAYYPGFLAVYQVITIIVLYLLMSFNRIEFYQVDEKS